LALSEKEPGDPLQSTWAASFRIWPG